MPQPLQIGWSGEAGGDRGRSLLPLVQFDKEGLEVVTGRAPAERADDVGGEARAILDFEAGEPRKSRLEARTERPVVWSQCERDEVRRDRDGCGVPFVLALAGQYQRPAIVTGTSTGDCSADRKTFALSQDRSDAR